MSGDRARAAVLAALVLAACLACLPPPTTYGIRSAGDIGDAGETRVTATGTILAVGGGAIGGAGADLEVAVHDRVSLAASAGTISGLFQGELELRVGLVEVPHGGLTLLGGGSILAADGAFVAPHVGLVGWGGFDDGARVYAGVVYNPILYEEFPGHWVHPTVGYAHRFSKAKPRARPTFGIEAGPSIGIVEGAAFAAFLGQVYVGGAFGGRKRAIPAPEPASVAVPPPPAAPEPATEPEPEPEPEVQPEPGPED